MDRSSPATSSDRMTRVDPLRRELAAAICLGLAIEAGPLALAVLAEPPVGVVIAPLGFVLAWAAIAARAGRVGRAGRGGRLDIADAGAVWRSLVLPILGVYVFAVAVALSTLLVMLLATGLILPDPVAVAVVAAAIAAVLIRSSYVIPCLVDGDDLIGAFERARVLWRAGGWPGVVRIVIVVTAGLGPPIVVAVLTAGAPPLAAFLATWLTLALTGPIVVFGLDHLRPSLEAAARLHDPRYGRP